MRSDGAELAELSGSNPSELEGSVATAFERAAALHADSIAVKTNTGALTYDALNRAANRLAHAIFAHRGAGEEPIAFIVDSEPIALVCLLGILKTGKAYVALDPALPLPRLQAVYAEVQPALVVTTAGRRTLADAIAVEPTVRLDMDELGTGLPDYDAALDIPPSRLAAIYFTSGSTGQPKGVCYDHRVLLHRIFTTTRYTELGVRDRQALHLRCDTSWSATIIFSTLFSGATLYPIDVTAVGACDMAEWVAREAITHFPLTCSLLRQWMDALPDADVGRYPSLRVVHAAAEPLQRRDVEQFRQHFPGSCVLLHSLATSECARIACARIVGDTALPEEQVFAGYPEVGKEILIVGEDGRWAASGESGEIAVRSCYMMSGYWRKPKLTAAVLRPDPDGSEMHVYFTGDIGRIRGDGQLEVFGRRDFQAKVRGYRVQPAEVEMHLLNLETISEAVVVALTESDGDTRLVAYLVAQGETTPSVAGLRAALAQTLAGYMIPSAFIFLSTLPLTPAGKVDRRALPRPSSVRPLPETTYIAPRNALEVGLVRIWEEVLPVAPIGVDDEFFNLGGNSLQAFSVLSRVREDFAVNLLPQDLIACATIGAMAALIAQRQQTTDV